jgi:hypothetical protein
VEVACVKGVYALGKSIRKYSTGELMTVSSLFRQTSRIALGLCLMAAVAACSTSRHTEQAEGGKITAPKIAAPTTEQELKKLPRGLLPDTRTAAHSGEVPAAEAAPTEAPAEPTAE